MLRRVMAKKNSKTSHQEIAKDLSKLLANTYILYVKTQNFHWNVEDPRFYSLHKFFEEQYEELAEALDTIAERIRMIGEKSPAALTAFLKLATLKDAGNQLSGDKMLQALLQDHEALIRDLHPQIEFSNDHEDEGTGDMLIERLRAHEKAAWMIRSHLVK